MSTISVERPYNDDTCNGYYTRYVWGTAVHVPERYKLRQSWSSNPDRTRPEAVMMMHAYASKTFDTAPKPVSAAAGAPVAGAMIYTKKPGGRTLTSMHQGQGNCVSDGIRFDMTNDSTLVDRETTWIIINQSDAAGVDKCTNKPWWSPKMGSHSDSGSFLHEVSVLFKGGIHGFRSESPHGTYKKCNGAQWINVPPMPVGKPIGIKGVVMQIGGALRVEYWYDFTNGGNGPWTKFAWLLDHGTDCSGLNAHLAGLGGKISGKAQDTLRGNGASWKFIKGSIVELAPNQPSKGGGTAIATPAPAAPAAAATPSAPAKSSAPATEISGIGFGAGSIIVLLLIGITFFMVLRHSNSNNNKRH